jgi:hypothetical protein
VALVRSSISPQGWDAVVDAICASYDLGWGLSIVTNFQIDGAISGTSSGHVCLDELSVACW